MKNIFIVTIALLLLFFGVLSLTVYLKSKGLLSENISVNDIRTEIQDDMDGMRDFIEHEHEHEEETEEYHYPKDAQMDVLKKNQNPEYVARLLFGAALLEDKELFASAFDFEILNKDLFSSDTPDKEELLFEIMNRLTRNNMLESINVIKVKQDEFETDIEVVLLLIYQGGYKSTVILNMRPIFTEHFSEDGIFAVITSAWEIIEQIEGA